MHLDVRTGVRVIEQRWLPPQAFLDGLGHERTVLPQRAELLRVGEEAIEQVARRPVGGFGAGGEQQAQERADLVVGELHTVQLCLGEHATDPERVRPRVAMIPQKYSYSAADAERPVHVDADADQLGGQTNWRMVVVGQGEHLGDDVEREGEREVTHEVGVAVALELVDERGPPAR